MKTTVVIEIAIAMMIMTKMTMKSKTVVSAMALANTTMKTMRMKIDGWFDGRFFLWRLLFWNSKSYWWKQTDQWWWFFCW
jgi:hypothetical protein